jgi:hypothetical protein
MKSLVSFFFCCAFLSFASISIAQLPDGNIAPDWTATDINGVEHNLYSYLDSGYAVIMDMSATWCGPCWNYHTAGVLEDLHATHGPDGTNTVRVFMIESDDSTTDDDLHGTGPNTWGDWTDGVDYGIIDNGGSIFNTYECTYYPTIFTICPNRILDQTGQASFESHSNYIQSMSCAPASLPLDAGILSYTGSTSSCPGVPTPLSVRIINNGLEPLTSCIFQASTLFGTDLLTYEWTGNLDTYEIIDVELGDASFATTSFFFVDIISEDGYEGNNSVSTTMNLSSQTATSLVRIQFSSDGTPADNRWAISDASGAEVAGIGFGEMTDSNSDYTWWVNLPTTGCYKFDLYDQTGNGGDIACDISTFNEALENINTIFTANNSGFWSNLNKGFLVNEINLSIAEGTVAAPTLSIQPNPNHGLVNVQGWADGTTEILIYHTTGGLVKHISLKGIRSNATIDVSDLAPGVYLLSAQSPKGIESIRMIKK